MWWWGGVGRVRAEWRIPGWKRKGRRVRRGGRHRRVRARQDRTVDRHHEVAAIDPRAKCNRERHLKRAFRFEDDYPRAIGLIRVDIVRVFWVVPSSTLAARAILDLSIWSWGGSCKLCSAGHERSGACGPSEALSVCAIYSLVQVKEGKCEAVQVVWLVRYCVNEGESEFSLRAAEPSYGSIVSCRGL